jgi:hypothetical protein
VRVPSPPVRGLSRLLSGITRFQSQWIKTQKPGTQVALASLAKQSPIDCGEFSDWQDMFGPFVLAKQKAALRFAGSFAPKSNFTLSLRNQLFKLMAIRCVADLAVGRDLADKITLPAY